MQYDIEVNGQSRQVTVVRNDGGFVVSFDDQRWVVDAAHVAGHTLSLLVVSRESAEGADRDPSRRSAEGADRDPSRRSAEGAKAEAVFSHEIPVAIDPVSGHHVFGIGPVPVPVSLNARRRYGRKDEAASGGSGPQRIVAPMPGKIVRIVGKPGDAVLHRQPVVVIEAMKMENELRASRDGTVTEVLVQEGQSVEAGTLLAIITPS